MEECLLRGLNPAWVARVGNKRIVRHGAQVLWKVSMECWVEYMEAPCCRNEPLMMLGTRFVVSLVLPVEGHKQPLTESQH